jgi:hypothetical protein
VETIYIQWRLVHFPGVNPDVKQVVMAHPLRGIVHSLPLHPHPRARWEMFRLALDIHQAPPERIVYIDNTPMFVRIAEGPGIRSILHADCESTRDKPAFLGLKIIK